MNGMLVSATAWINDPASFQSFKLRVIEATGLGKDALHIYAGMAVFVAVRLAWRWRGGWMVAWAAALAVALAAEWLDVRGERVLGGGQADAAHWHDIWNTMFWPTVLMVIGRWLHPSGDAIPFATAPSDETSGEDVQ